MNINKINPYILNSSLSGYSSQKVKPYILAKNPEYKLPDEVSDLYEQVEYLESTGEQYIDTGYIPDRNDDIYIRVYCINNAAFFGTLNFVTARPANLSDYRDFFRIFSTLGIQSGTLLPNTWDEGYYNGTTHVFSMHNDSVTAGTDVCEGSLWLFGRSDTQQMGKSRISNFDVKNKLSFIPCYRKVDNKPGLYDAVNDVFYTNANQSASQDFIVGNTVSKYIPQKVKINILSSSSRLPSEYQEVEYLESTGEQWIDTGVSLRDLPYFEITYQIDNIMENVMGRSFGFNGNSRCAIGVGSQLTYYWGIGNQNLEGVMYPPVDLLKHTQYIDVYNNKYGIDDTAYNFTGTFNSDTKLNIYLFARRTNDDVNPYFTGRLYDSKIKLNDVDVRNFIPCYRKADNKPGLYDLVNDVFYVNANTSASQDFIVGPNVN